MRRSLAALALLAALAAGCSDPFAEARKVDSIEAWEQFLAEHPDSPRRLEAQIRLAELLLEKAREEGTVEAYDAALEKVPETEKRLHDKIWEERREVLYRWADRTDTVEAWKRYVEEYPSGDKKRKQEARNRLKLAEYLRFIEMGPVGMERINLARDPKGPLNGWEFRRDVTWNGDRPVQHLDMRIYYLDADGNVLDTRDWPLVAEHLPGFLPMPEGFDRPMRKGETRTWKWTTGDLPAGWARKVWIKPVEIRFADEEKGG